MATQAKARGAPPRTSGGFGLRMLAVMLGVFFVAMSVSKIGWLTDSSILLQIFQQRLPNATPAVRWYLETVCIPGAPIFARLVPLGELCAGIALIVGFWTRMAAIAALVMVLNFHFAISAFSSPAFLSDGTGLPVLGGLLALAMTGAHLPFSASR